nr:TMEM165/GDT1 family protein [Candidatus Methanofastidiosa archaeon]
MGYLEAFIVSAALIGVAELGDKTQIALLSLSGKYKKKTPLLVGSFMGFALVDGMAVVFGGTISSLVPQDTISLAASVVFILFGVYFLFEKEEKMKEANHKSLLLTSFMLITLMELGDKTQLITMTLAARYDSMIGVFLGAMAALMFLSSVAIIVGKALSERI